jgi:hypothetical protein
MADIAKKPTLQEEANSLFASTSHKVLWGNPAGEFFTSENIGLLSLKPKQTLTKFERPTKVVKPQKETPEETK